MSSLSSALPMPGEPPAGEGAAWVAGVRAGDERAFEALYRAFHRPLCLYVAGYVRSSATAQDIVQDLLCGVWENRTSWAPQEVRRYLFFAARNRALNVLKRERTAGRWVERATADDLPSGMSAAPATPDDEIRHTELREAVVAAIEALPSRCRQAWTLRWQVRMSNAEIAASMGISVKAVEFQMARALKSLREALEPIL